MVVVVVAYRGVSCHGTGTRGVVVVAIIFVIPCTWRTSRNVRKKEQERSPTSIDGPKTQTQTDMTDPLSSLVPGTHGVRGPRPPGSHFSTQLPTLATIDRQESARKREMAFPYSDVAMNNLDGSSIAVYDSYMASPPADAAGHAHSRASSSPLKHSRPTREQETGGSGMAGHAHSHGNDYPAYEDSDELVKGRHVARARKASITMDHILSKVPPPVQMHTHAAHAYSLSQLCFCEPSFHANRPNHRTTTPPPARRHRGIICGGGSEWRRRRVQPRVAAQVGARAGTGARPRR